LVYYRLKIKIVVYFNMKKIQKTNKTKIQKKKKQHRQTGGQKTGGKHQKTLKKMNCSPAVDGKTPVKGSCFPAEVLQKLKTSYNQHHTHHAIHATDPQDVWKELKERMSVCTKEDCWLDVIQSPAERKKLDKHLFAPDHPKEWIKNPNEWLTNYDILAVLQQYEKTDPSFRFIGPTPIDFDERPTKMDGQCVWEDLCNLDIRKMLDSKKTNLGIIFNLDKHDGPGSHWVSLFVNLKDNYVFYMDSGGAKIPKEIDNLVKRIQDQALKINPHQPMKFYQNHPMEHQMGNTECGIYSLFFIITMLTGEIEKGQISTIKQKHDFFTKKRIPDKYIEKFRQVYFNQP